MSQMCWPYIPQAECVQHGLRTLAFCKTRKLCELVTAYTRETLRDTAPHLCDTISVYRAGYSPQVGLLQSVWRLIALTNPTANQKAAPV